MIILFDIFLSTDARTEEKINNLSVEEGVLLETIFVFVEDHIKVLQSEIDKEEEEYLKLHPRGAIGTIIELKNNRVSFVHYSDNLIERLKDCFTKGDNKILAERLAQAFSYLN